MKKGSSLIEVAIASLIIITALIVFLIISSNYLRTLKNAEELFILNSLAFEGTELLTGLRNKLIETTYEKEGLSITTPPNWRGNYCLNFDANINKIQLDSTFPCQVKFLGDQPNIQYYRILKIDLKTHKDTTYLLVTSTVTSTIWPSPPIEINKILTPWHPSFQ